MAISALRAELASWIERVRSGEEVVVTDRGTPVVRLLAIDATPIIEQLTQQGVLSPATGQPRPLARRAPRVTARGAVADYVAEQRR